QQRHANRHRNAEPVNLNLLSRCVSDGHASEGRLPLPAVGDSAVGRLAWAALVWFSAPAPPCSLPPPRENRYSMPDRRTPLSARFSLASGWPRTVHLLARSAHRPYSPLSCCLEL